MSENHPPHSEQDTPAIDDNTLDEIIKLRKSLKKNRPKENVTNEQYNQDKAHLEQIYDELIRKRNFTMEEIDKQIKTRKQQIYDSFFDDKAKKKKEEEAKKQEQQEKTNEDIIKAQSQTINMIGKALQQYSPSWIARLSNHIKDFLLFKDGHILFSKSWLKNGKFILSAPLIFRPAYNIILHPVLKFIDRYFATNQCPTHPGGIFYITGDQGVGKTSLMLILMSSLSDHSLNFHYQKGIKGEVEDIQNFKHMIGGDGEFTFSAYKSKDKSYMLLYIHIHDDSPPPEAIEPNHLYIIFTSPDQKRLQRPTLDTGQICHVFRLPTFSLAENAVLMVGCTPTVPFFLLSPEDMELRKEEQQTLFLIEKEKEERAGQLPLETPISVTTTSQQEFAKTHLKALVEREGDSSARLNGFSHPFVKLLLTDTKGHRFHNSINAFLNDVFTMRTRSNLPPDEDATPSTRRHLNWATAVQTLTDSIKTIDKAPEGNQTTRDISQLQDTPESIETLVKDHLGRQTDFDQFSRSLCRKIMESRDLPSNNDRVLAIIDWLMDQIIDHSERDKTQTLYIKQLIHALVLSELNEQDSESGNRQNQKTEAAKTESRFHLAKTYTPPPPDLRPAIDSLSNSIEKAKLTEETTSSEQTESKTLATTQLTSLKKHLKEPDIHEVTNRLIVRDEVERISQLEGKGDKKQRICLFDSLINMTIVTPPFYNSHKHTLQSLFVLPTDKERDADIYLRNNLTCLYAESNKETTPKDKLSLIVTSLVQCLLDSQTHTNPPGATESSSNYSKRKMAQTACDLLTMIVDPKHTSVEKRLESVMKEIEDVQNRFSFVLLMDRFSFIAQDMNILVTPHSILKGLSERAEQPPPDLNVEREQVFRRNMRDTGLSKWVAKATMTLLGKMKPDDTQCVNCHEEPATSETTLEESVLKTVTSSILANLNKVINEFFEIQKFRKNKVAKPQWLAILRSMMNTILFLIDAGMPRRKVLTHCSRLRELLTVVYSTGIRHLQRVEESRKRCIDYLKGLAMLDIEPAVRDDGTDSVTEKNPAYVNPDTDYVGDLTILSTHFRAKGSQATPPDFDVESLRTLELPRTLQIGPTSQNRLERMSIALFARNLLWFLEMEEDLPFDDECNVRQFFTEFLQDENPGDIVHRSFVDFMNMTGLLSQQNFGLKREEFLWRPTEEKAALESETDTLQKMSESLSLHSPKNFVTLSNDVVQIPSNVLAIYSPKDDEHQPFHNFMTKQFGIYLVLWASTELLFKAAKGAASQTSQTEKTASSLNVARASVFGPSPRWLTSTDARTNRGLSFLWDGVLKSEKVKELADVADSNHSRIMSFNTDRIFFEDTLDAAWDDITTLVPLLPDYKKAEKRPTLVRSVFSLIFKKTKAAIERMKSQISFVALSPFVEQIVQSEVVSAIAKLMTQADYEKFCRLQEAKNIENLPDYVEEPLVCISFLLNCPTPARFSTTTTSFHNEYVYKGKGGRFRDYKPILSTTSKQVSSIPMLSFPEVTNRSVEKSPFPQTLSATKRGETDFYAEELQDLKGKHLAGLDALIVSRGSEATHETIFMPIQATSSKTHSLVKEGIVLIQQLLFQAMAHLEPSEGIVAMYNYATTQKEPKFPSQTKILGFHMVSSLLKFEENTLTHMPSILRHRDHPLVTIPTEPHSTMTTRDITDTLLANVGHYPTFSTEFDPWTTTLSSVNDLTDPYLTLPFRWKGLYDLFWKSSTDGSTRVAGPLQITGDEKKAKDWLDRMVRRTMQELNRIGVSPADLGETETERVNAFSSFVLSTAISCRRNELLDPTTKPITSTDDTKFVELVQSIVGPIDSETLKCLLSSINEQPSTTIDSIRHQRLRSLDKLCRHPCIDAKLHTVTRVMSNHAMKRIRSPTQKYLSVLQSEKDRGVFRVPTRNDLSAILHCGTVLLDNITPLPHIDTTSTLDRGFPRLTSSPLPPNQTTTQLSTPPQLSPTSKSLPRSKTLRIPLHSLVLAKYGFSDSIPALCELTQDQVQKEVTNVTPAPLSRWHPCQVVIDPSLFPQLIPSEDPLSLFTSFIHRLFDNTFIPVTTSLSTPLTDFRHDDNFILDQIRIITNILSKTVYEDKTQLPPLINTLSTIQPSQQKYRIFSLLPEIRSSLKKFNLSPRDDQDILKAIESIEPLRPQPTLLFVKSGSDFFTSPNASCLDGVDTTTESLPFPIAFSTGYKETDLREEMKQVFEPLTRLLPDNFPTGRPSLVHVDKEGKQELRKPSSSKRDAKSRARGIMDLAFLRMGATSRTPLFVFVVDEDLADHSSLPMSLRSSDGSVGCGMMWQRSLADVLWILFLTRISREVMALPFNTSVTISDFSNSVIPFLSNTLIEDKLITVQEQKDENDEKPVTDRKKTNKSEEKKLVSDSKIFSRTGVEFVPSIVDILISRATTPRHGDNTKISSVGLELLVSAYPRLTDETHIILLSRLLMICPASDVDKPRSSDPLNLPASATPSNDPLNPPAGATPSTDPLNLSAGATPSTDPLNPPAGATPSTDPLNLPAGATRLDALVNHPSPEIGMVSLIRWFQLLNSNIEKDTQVKRPIEQTIEDHNFSSAKIRANLLRALHIIVEREGRDDFITQLFNAIKPLLDRKRVPLFFSKTHLDEIDRLERVGDNRFNSLQNEDSPYANALDDIMERINLISGLIIKQRD
ncbi:hypothetical protein BLNAU_7809 [Blattamonas nauphoetae]|uniref:Uncharacterized protein n=1 Tax=Blattamonas nauphoetae TaxID=2049346 RepID=A0ABQ9Y0E4_9EUKA|nr:hypothetical protein BLNAU_7809 [Blattamonas nauphoetae]